jgi:hypothetical protein
MPATLRVQLGSTEEGVFTSITGAITASHPYDTIIVEEGVYEEAMTVNKPNVLITAAPKAEVTVVSTGCALTLENSEGIVRGFKFIQRGAGYCVKTTKSHGQPRVESCEITRLSLRARKEREGGLCHSMHGPGTLQRGVTFGVPLVCLPGFLRLFVWGHSFDIRR